MVVAMGNLYETLADRYLTTQHITADERKRQVILHGADDRQTVVGRLQWRLLWVESSLCRLGSHRQPDCLALLY